MTAMMMSAEQCRAARALLGLTQRELAVRSNVRVKLVNSFEATDGVPVEKTSARTGQPYFTPAVSDNYINRMQDFLESCGVVFLFNGETVKGVRLRDQEPYRVSQENAPLLAMHFKLARAWLDWTHDKLAEMADISPSTVRDFEKGRRSPHMQNLAKAEIAIKMRGIRFIFNRDHEAIGIEVVNGLAIAA